MKNKIYIIAFLMLSSTLISLPAIARESIDVRNGKTNEALNATIEACSRAQARTVFDLNNVRTILLTAGDMWWAATSGAPGYEIPKGGGAHSLFAGALWIGGIDNGGNLKVAAMTYRSNGDDFWPGTIDTANLQTESNRCNYYDKHYRITRKEVEDYLGWLHNADDYPGYIVPESIKKWPAYGNQENASWPNETKSLAPFHDADGDGVYTVQTSSSSNPNGLYDYPNYNITGSTDCNNNLLFGDETLWWVFNDVGNIHTETNGDKIGLEIQAQAFAFQTNDDINNMTFYKYKISNHSQQPLDSTFFGQWVDSDLGGADDDYVGCDVGKGLGYTYNGRNYDYDAHGNKGYGDELPAMGIDFFEGPFVNLGGTQDLPRTISNPASSNGSGYSDGIPGNERAGMAKFVFYNRSGGPKGDPQNATEYYNYCSGSWRDGTPFTYGGDAKGGPTPCSYMYPGSSDPDGFGTNGLDNTPWSETGTYGDRRFFQSAGPFRLDPGVVNYVTVGAVWARAPKGAPATDAIPLLVAADVKAQRLFDNCFKVLDGPDAPDLTIQEIDKELLVYITNKPSSNNYLEKYKEYDPNIIGFPDSTYDFEGYQIFQLKDASVSSVDLYNPDKARLVKQMDLKNGIEQIVNFNYDGNLGGNIPQEMVDGENLGITHSFRITEDLFASGNKTLVNHKQYYYMAVAYGENNYKKYDPLSPSDLDGQKLRYKAGRKNLKVYTGIPHIPSPEASGTATNSSYGYGPKLRRIEGQGNGGQYLELTQETISKIMSSANYRDSLPEYENGKGPINVKVIDPLNVPAADFTFYMLDPVVPSPAPINEHELDDAEWMLKNNTSDEVVYSNRNIKVADEAIISKWGLSVTVKQVPHPIDSTALNSGFIGSSITFGDESKKWITGVVDEDNYTTRNWIRSGVSTSTQPGLDAFNDNVGLDDDGVYEKVAGGTWAPYALTYTSDEYDLQKPGSPYAKGGVHSDFGTESLRYLSSVDIVFTSDKSLWTRCPVLEMCDDPVLVGGVVKHTPRHMPSVNKYGQAGVSSSNDDYNSYLTSDSGMSWFPGYAINVETGERLNMAFGENSYLESENGNDMMWNPTSVEYQGSTNYPYFGGQHYIYVFNHIEDPRLPLYATYMAAFPRYDKGKFFMDKLSGQPGIPKRNIEHPSVQQTIWRACIWASIPLLTSDFKTLSQPGKNIEIPTEVKVKLRVNKPYQRGFSTQNIFSTISQGLIDTVLGSPAQNNNRPMYTFSTHDLQTQVSDADAAKKALDLINVVPNPYYAYSAYEGHPAGAKSVDPKLDRRIKITNLPEKCNIKIYTLNGTLIKKFAIDQPATAKNTMGVPVTSQEWELKNEAGIPIASGLYIIYVDVPGVGEKVLKWFGVMRPMDLESY